MNEMDFPFIVLSFHESGKVQIRKYADAQKAINAFDRLKIRPCRDPIQSLRLAVTVLENTREEIQYPDESITCISSITYAKTQTSALQKSKVPRRKLMEKFLKLKCLFIR